MYTIYRAPTNLLLMRLNSRSAQHQLSTAKQVCPQVKSMPRSHASPARSDKRRRPTCGRLSGCRSGGGRAAAQQRPQRRHGRLRRQRLGPVQLHITLNAAGRPASKARERLNAASIPAAWAQQLFRVHESCSGTGSRSGFQGLEKWPVIRPALAQGGLSRQCLQPAPDGFAAVWARLSNAAQQVCRQQRRYGVAARRHQRRQRPQQRGAPQLLLRGAVLPQRQEGVRCARTL
jgi:hypothetical protein